MLRALEEYRIAGVATTIPFCRFVLEHESFRDGTFSTHFVEDHFDARNWKDVDEDFEKLAAMAAVLYTDQFGGGSTPHAKPEEAPSQSRWLNRRRSGNRRHW
jgi:propionyl-CoA carboxylase alpha chain